MSIKFITGATFGVLGSTGLAAIYKHSDFDGSIPAAIAFFALIVLISILIGKDK